jgi:16S rRNA (guanine527-N7)-methyltransferase
MPPDTILTEINKVTHVSHETFERLTLYHELLIKWQAKINLVGGDTLADAWRRHFLDSLQLISHLPSLDEPMIDMGTGAGFPGMVLAIMGAPAMHLIESDTKKIVFLNEVSRLCKAPVTIHHSRIEDCENIPARVITSRALASLTELLSYSEPHVSRETICLFPKGKNYAMELEGAKRSWSFDQDIFPSVTDSHGVIVRLSSIHRGAKNDQDSFHR